MISAFVMRRGDKDRYLVISFFNEKKSGFGIALKEDKSPKQVQDELNEKLEWLWKQ